MTVLAPEKNLAKTPAEVAEFDKKYFFHTQNAQDEYVPFIIDRTEGCWLIDVNGKRYLDFNAQLNCVNLGHRVPEIEEAIVNSLQRFGFVWEGLVTDYRSNASKLIVSDLVGNDNWAGKIRFVSTGSEAVEEAIILAKLYTNRSRIITQQYGYHGWTHGAGQLTRLRKFRGLLASKNSKAVRDVPGFETGQVLVVPAPYCYRCPLGQKYPSCRETNQERKLACVKQSEKIIEEAGPENFAAMIIEPILASSAIIPPKEYLPQMVGILQKFGILYIDDEVITGFGRTGKWFGYQHYLDENVRPDLMTMGKGIISSALPAAGVVISEALAKWFEDYRWYHVSTYGSHPVVMAAIVANLETMKKVHLDQRAAAAGEHMGMVLKHLERKHKCVGFVAGQGLFWTIEFVKNKQTDEPFVPEDRDATYAGDRASFPTELIRRHCAKEGLLCSASGPNTIRIGPPLTITNEEIDFGGAVLDRACDELDKLCPDSNTTQIGDCLV